MSFRFNFSHSDSNTTLSTVTSKDETVIKKGSKDEKDDMLNHCNFISLENKYLQNTKENISLLKIGDLDIKYVLLKSLKVKTKDETFSQIHILQTDLIPGKYEGGLKIWECSIDLAIYLAENDYIKDKDSVLELGCGAGLPGIVAYLKGAHVTFQDFNSEVLEYVTIPNTVLNTTPDKIVNIPEICQYLYGDWESIYKKYYSDTQTEKKYDVILTSETIYEKSNQKKLLDLMKSALKSEGTIYLAAKIYYFGVGGGIADFELLVKNDNTFEVTSTYRITAGIERQILVMKFIKNRKTNTCDEVCKVGIK